MLDEAGFDTLESLTLPVSEFREEVTGMKAGHARALINMVAEDKPAAKSEAHSNQLKIIPTNCGVFLKHPAKLQPAAFFAF